MFLHFVDEASQYQAVRREPLQATENIGRLYISVGYTFTPAHRTSFLKIQAKTLLSSNSNKTAPCCQFARDNFYLKAATRLVSLNATVNQYKAHTES